MPRESASAWVAIVIHGPHFIRLSKWPRSFDRSVALGERWLRTDPDDIVMIVDWFDIDDWNEQDWNYGCVS